MKRGRLWLVAALVLFVAAGWLMQGKRPPPAKPKHTPSEFPRYMRPSEHERQRARAVPMTPPPDAGAAAAGTRLRDPFLAALPPSGPGRAKTAIVFEAEAIKSMPVGRMFMRCLKDREAARMEQEIGVSPEAIDRVAVSKGLMIFGGDFAGAKWDRLGEHAKEERHGRATVWTRTDRPGSDNTIARWDDGHVIVGKTRAEVLAAIDRMEGGESGPPAINEDEAYGEVYGVLGVDDLARIIARQQPELAERIESAAERVELHVDATGDVLLVGDMSGPDATALGDLGKSLGGAMSVARMSAKADGNEDLAELLDAARVSRYGDAYRFEAALPLATIEKTLGPCAKEGDAGVDDE